LLLILRFLSTLFNSARCDLLLLELLAHAVILGDPLPVDSFGFSRLLLLVSPVLGVVLEYVSFMRLQHAHPVLELPLLLQRLEGTTIELDHYLGLVQDASLVIGFKGGLTLPLFEGVGMEGLLQGDLRGVGRA
jgi:hypothetical protein